ncbi:MAG: UDP-4-amino-4,6-dideoxy-N-acetyl-beta-L-altrosamine transaminase [Candidatus Omnitrophica bacterium]|nr:UDP-4-amino-4,6-dideoxy-N-acetyl-beta-L-altrosamine transaminase [Candidatus Omnitrophota bacterium]MDD5671002.1 UDP-4-amino-4,6-dideoxy-N-acetyl-beta-L-altrosamine transaminase [Candidatus Omnitrophota bacterium]
MTNIPYSRQRIDAVDIKAVGRVLATDWITQGPKIDEFERAIARFCGARYAVAVANGTAALHLAALAAGLKKGDEAITTPITFLATSNAVLYAGATPVFADIDYDTVNIDPDCVKKLVTRKTKAVLPVDFAGLPADMPAIRKIADRHGLVVIEDASHALGGEYRHGKVGSCRYADMTVFSFHPVKHITTGEGGCITTNSKTYYDQLRALRTHGVVKTADALQKHGGWYYEMQALGFNYRITDFQCALGLSQLKKLPGFIAARRKIARRYDAAFATMGNWLKIPAQAIHGEKHVYHLYLLRLARQTAKCSRRLLYEYLKSQGVSSQVHYIPIYRQPYYRKLFSGRKIHCPNADRYYSEALSLPIYPGLSSAGVDKVIHWVGRFLKTGAGECAAKSRTCHE